jgi:hypothetical protein
MALTAGKKVLIGVGATLTAIVIAIGSLYGYYNSVRNEGISLENGLEAQYRTNQNELSTYSLSVLESLGVADKATTKQKEIIVEAIKGRYDGNMEPGTGGAYFSSITEAYPEQTGTTEAYGKVQDQIVAGRNAYKNQQNKLLDQIRAYENWAQQGGVRHIFVSMIGFPSPTLEATVGDNTYTGAEALKYMKRLVLTEDTATAYETGKTAPLIVPETAPTK